MSVALCLPNALLSCEPARLPHAFDTSLLFALYLFHYILLPSVTCGTELTPSRSAGSTEPHSPKDHLQSWLPTLTHLIVPFLCYPATVPSYHCLSPQWSHHCSQTVVYPIRNESSGYLYCYISPTSHIDVFAFFLIATELDPSAAPLSPFGLIYPYPNTAIANLSIWEAS